MRILGHIHSLNDEEVIEGSLQALLDQTHPVDEILVVDNGSTDGTLNRRFPEHVTIIRLPENRGTSGAVATGLQYAMANRYDWIWILDADSAPSRNALATLLDLYQSFPLDVQAQVRVLACLPLDAKTRKPYHGIVFTPRGYEHVHPEPGKAYYECDITIFSGSLFKIGAVRRIGLPRAEYVLDGGECEYAYQGKQAGYRVFIHQDSILEHNTGPYGGDKERMHHIGPVTFRMPELPSIRLYYIYRNATYFWLYVYHRGNVFRYLRQSDWMVRHLVKLLLLSRWPELRACARGLWDGLRKHMHRRY